jgi:hypothetical protein
LNIHRDRLRAIILAEMSLLYNSVLQRDGTKY